MLDFIKNIAGVYGYIGIFFLMFLESSILIVPSELIMGVAGYLAFKGILNIYIATLFAALGNITGSTVLYMLSKFGRTNILLKYGGKKVKIGIEKGQKLFKRFGNWAILVAQFIPGVRAVISIPAGILEVPYVPFILATFVGAYLWCGILGMGAYWLGQNWYLIHDYLKMYEHLVLGLLVIVILWIGLQIYKRK